MEPAPHSCALTGRTSLTMAIVAELAFAAAVCYYVLTRLPDNHSGLDIRWALIVLPIPLAISCFSLVRRCHRPLAFTLLTLTISLGIAVVLVDQTNTLLNYERWIQRGMPSSPFSPPSSAP